MKSRTHYLKTDYSRDFSLIFDESDELPDAFDLNNLEETHELVTEGAVQFINNDFGASRDDDFRTFVENQFKNYQGEFMDPETKDRIEHHIKHGDISHTSMSVGDIVELIDMETNEHFYYMIVGIGTKKLS